MMRQTNECLRCGETCQRLESRGNPPLFYCSVCGWNVSTAQIHLANVRFGLRFGMVLSAIMLPLVIAASPNRRNSLEDCVLIALLLAGMVWFVQRRLSRDSRRLAQIDEKVAKLDSYETNALKPDSETLAEFERVSSLSRPRSIRLNKSSRSALLVMRIIPVGMWLWGIHDLIFPRHPIGLAEQSPLQARACAVGLFVLGVVLWFLFNKSFEKKAHLEVLRNGEVALARITRAVSRRVVTPVMEYTFCVPNGALVHGQGEDIGGIHNEGDHLIVLYPRQAPEKSLPLCATNYEFPKA
jgi:hypothetical protein